ncbi:MAG: restriction endonuclease subunit S [Candidatus Methanoperedens sp.]|nr:restriction endonuclease subunit S [Candidatus Methanoperedens sp.]
MDAHEGRALPEGWEWKRLIDVLLSLENGARPKGGVDNIAEGVPSVGGEHLNKEGGFIFETMKFIPKEFYEGMRRGRIEGGDVLVVKDGATTGKVSLVREDYPYQESAVNEHVFICRPNQKSVLPEYLFYNLFCPLGQNKILRSFHGAAQGGINTQFANDYEIPLPPLPTQRRIVSLLEKAEETKRLRAQADELSDMLLQSVFLEMFGDPVKNPKGWEIKTMNEICERITDGEHITPQRTNEGIYLLSARNIQNHKIALDDVDFIDEEEYERISRRIRPQKGDILISCSGTIGRVARVKDNFKFQLVRSVALVRPIIAYSHPIYLEYIFTTNLMKNQIKKAVNQSSQANLFQGKIRKLFLPLPPLPLQQKFARIVEKIESMRQSQNQSKQQIEDLFNALMQKAFKGELVA